MVSHRNTAENHSVAARKKKRACDLESLLTSQGMGTSVEMQELCQARRQIGGTKESLPAESLAAAMSTDDVVR